MDALLTRVHTYEDDKLTSPSAMQSWSHSKTLNAGIVTAQPYSSRSARNALQSQRGLHVPRSNRTVSNLRCRMMKTMRPSRTLLPCISAGTVI